MKIGETITITVANQDIVLRPRLRDGFRLERRKGGIMGLATEISQHSLGATCEIIRGHSNMPFLESRIYDAGVANLSRAMSLYIVGLMGLDPDTDRPAKGTKLKSVPFSEHFDRLYAVATGWLGWPPEVALDAAPIEIIHAYHGRIDMLRSVLGGEEDSTTERTEPQNLDAKVKAIFGNMGTVKTAA